MSDLAPRLAVLLRGEETDGVLSLIESTVPPGWGGPPLHHHDFDEAFYVLDGQLTLQVGDDLVAAGPHALVFSRGGTRHTLANLTDAPARYLILRTPAGRERFFDRLAAELAGPPAPLPPAEPVAEATVAGPPLAPAGDPEQALVVAPPKARINVLLRGAENGGRMAVMDNVVPPGRPGPPLHHHAFDELFYVVEGELTFQLGDALMTRAAGQLAFAPRGAPHTFANRSDADARTLLVCTPAGFEGYFARLAAEQAGVEPPEWATAPTPSVTRVGPPIGVDD